MEAYYAVEYHRRVDANAIDVSCVHTVWRQYSGVSVLLYFQAFNAVCMDHLCVFKGCCRA